MEAIGQGTKHLCFQYLRIIKRALSEILELDVPVHHESATSLSVISIYPFLLASSSLKSDASASVIAGQLVVCP